MVHTSPTPIHRAHSPKKKELPILITGGAGFIGGNLTRMLRERGHELHIVDNLVTGRKENLDAFEGDELVHFYNMDINDPDFFRMFTKIPVQQIYHLACPTGVPNIRILSMEMLTTCSIGTFHVMELAKKYKAPVLFTSSCEVYGQPEVCPQPDDYNGNVNPVGPRSPYEEGKRFSESIVSTYARKHGLDAKIVRLFNVYGPGMSPSDQRVLPSFLRSIRRGETLKVYGDGGQTRTFLYVDDVVLALHLVMNRGTGGETYNIGGTAQITIRDLAQLVMSIAGCQAEVECLPHFTEDHNRRQPVINKLMRLGWQQKVSLEEGIGRMIAATQDMPVAAEEQPVVPMTVVPAMATIPI